MIPYSAQGIDMSLIQASSIPREILGNIIPVDDPAFLDEFAIPRAVVYANIPVLDSFQGIPQSPGEHVVDSALTSNVISQILNYVRDELNWNYLYVIGRLPNRLDPNSFTVERRYFARGLYVPSDIVCGVRPSEIETVRDIPVLGDRTLEL